VLLSVPSAKEFIVRRGTLQFAINRVLVDVETISGPTFDARRREGTDVQIWQLQYLMT
jgi:hypothetical protein